MSQEQFIRIPWQIIFEVCSAYLLTKEEFDQLTWDEFIMLCRRLRRG